MLKHLYLTIGTQLAILGANLLGGIMTARWLGPAGKGELAAVILWPSMFAAAGTFGLVEGLVYCSGREPTERINLLVSNSFLWAFLQSLLFGSLGYFLIPLVMANFDRSVIAVARIYLAFIPLNLLTLYLSSVFQGRMMMGIYNKIRFLVVGLYLLGIVMLAIWKQLTVRNCALVLLGANLGILLYELGWAARLGWLRPAMDKKLTRGILAYGFRVYGGNLASLLNSRLDQMIIATALTSITLGLYSVAVTLSGMVNLVTGAIAMVAFPSVSRLREGQRQREEVARFTRLTLWASGLGACGLLVCSSWLVPLLYGSAYIDAVPAMRVLVMAAFLSGLNQVLASGWRGLGKPLIATYGEITALLVTVICLAALLPKWQLVGAATAAFLAAIVNFSILSANYFIGMHMKPSSFLLPQQEDLDSLRSAARSLRARFING